MSIILFADNASSTLASAITNSQTTITVAATTGALFSNPGAGQIAYVTAQDVTGNIEVMEVTARSGDSMTVVRGADGTTPLAFASGTRIEQRVTASILSAFLQKTGGDTLSGTTNMSGILALGSGGSIQGGEFTGALRSAPGVTSNQILVPIGEPATAAGSPILTAANITANLASGTALITSGMILLWNGTSSSIPAGFVACNGSNGTPDLQDCFVLGAGGILPTSGGSTNTGSAGSHDHTGATGGYVLTEADMPTAGGAQLPFTFINLGQASGGSGTGSVLVTGSSAHSNIAFTGAANNSHTHSISVDGTHIHTNLPPYQALFYIMKT